MIPAHCLNPRCPILDTCKAKFAPPPENARPGTCYARPAPFLPIWLPPQHPDQSRENRFALMARQEHEIRRASIDGCADGQY